MSHPGVIGRPERRKNEQVRIRRLIAGAGVALAMAMMAMSPTMAKETPVPEKPLLYVRDDAGALNGNQKDDLDEILKEYDEKTGNQIAVLLVRTTGDESIEKYSYKVASEWGIGQKGNDNGILITIATEDHKDRIEVGKGLEGDVTDSRAGRILRSDKVTDAFRHERWYDGTHSIISQVQECISTKGKSVDRDAFFDGMLTRSVFFIFAGVLWIAVVRNLKLIAKKSTGGTAGILPWIGRAGGAASAGTVIFGPAKALIPLFAATFIIYLAIAIYADAIGVIPHSGSSSSGGWSSGSGSSSGSSFGGGSFGGGGASGGW